MNTYVYAPQMIDFSGGWGNHASANAAQKMQASFNIGGSGFSARYASLLLHVPLRAVLLVIFF